MDDRLAAFLPTEYEAWKVSPSGVVVCLTKPWTYTRSRIMVNVDLAGYGDAF